MVGDCRAPLLVLVLVLYVSAPAADGKKSVTWEDVDSQLTDYDTSSSPLQSGMGHCMKQMLEQHCSVLQPPLMPSGLHAGSYHTSSKQEGLCGMELETHLAVVDYSSRHGYVHEVTLGGKRVAHFSAFPTSRWGDFVAAIQAYSVEQQQRTAPRQEPHPPSSAPAGDRPQGRLRILDSLGSKGGAGARLGRSSGPPALRPQLGKCGREEVLLLLFLDGPQPLDEAAVAARGAQAYDTGTTSFIRATFPSVSPLLHESVTPLCCMNASSGAASECPADQDSFIVSQYGKPVGRVDRYPIEAYDELLEEHRSWQGLQEALERGTHSGTMDLSIVMVRDLHVVGDKVLRSTAAAGAVLLQELCSGDTSKELSDDQNAFGFMHCLAALEVVGKGMADMHVATAKPFDLLLIGHSWPRLVASLLPENAWAIRQADEGLTEAERELEGRMAAILHDCTEAVTREVVAGYELAAKRAQGGAVAGKGRGDLSMIHNDVRLDNMLVIGDFMESKKARRPDSAGEENARPRRRRRGGEPATQEGISSAQGEAVNTAIGTLAADGGEARMAPTSIASALAPAPSLLDIHKMNLELTDFAVKKAWGGGQLQRVIQHFRSSYSSVYLQELQSSHEEVLFRLFALQGLLVRAPGFALRSLLQLDNLGSCARLLATSGSERLAAACRKELLHVMATDTKFYPALLEAVAEAA